MRARLKGHVPPADGYTFSAYGGKLLKLGNDGTLRLTVMMWMPKDGPEDFYDVTLRVARDKEQLRATIASIKPGAQTEVGRYAAGFAIIRLPSSSTDRPVFLASASTEGCQSTLPASGPPTTAISSASGRSERLRKPR
jgi:hypothetical protein